MVKTPIWAPRANAFAERWVRTVRTECLDWILVVGRRHLERVLRTYTSHRPPDPAPRPDGRARVRRRDVWGACFMSMSLRPESEFSVPFTQGNPHGSAFSRLGAVSGNPRGSRRVPSSSSGSGPA